MSSVEDWSRVKLRDRNSHSGTSGWSERAIRSGNAIAATPPTTRATKAIGSCQLRSWPRIGAERQPADRDARRRTRPASRTGPRHARLALFGQVAQSWRRARTTTKRHVDQEGEPPRHEVDEQTADEGPEQRRGRRSARPDPEDAAALLAREGLRQDRQRSGTRIAPRRPGGHAPTISNSIVGARPHSTDVMPKPTRPIGYIRRRP